MDYTMFEIDDLLAERSAIDKEIQERADEELAALEERKAQLLSITGQVKTVPAPAVKPRKAGAAKYRNPENGALTWTGRGKKPVWMQSWIAKVWPRILQLSPLSKKPVWMQSWIAKGKDPNELLIAA